MESMLNLKYIVGALVYSLIGILVLIGAFLVFDRLTPGNLWKELVEEKNVALAILFGSMTLGLAHIIASAIHG